MARSTDTKRTAAKAKTPAKRSPSRRKPAAAPRSQRPEERARPTGRNGAAAEESTGAPAYDAVSAPVAPPEPEAAAAPLAVSGGEAEPAGGPDARPEARPGPEREARREEVRPEARPGPEREARREEVPSAPEAAPADAPEAPAEVASTPHRDAAPARAALEQVAAAAAAPALRRSLVEGTIDMHGQMVAFACRQTEVGLAAGRALLASRSLPEVVSLQSAFVGRSVENALAHTLELTRLSAEMLRQGLRSAGPR